MQKAAAVGFPPLGLMVRADTFDQPHELGIAIEAPDVAMATGRAARAAHNNPAAERPRQHEGQEQPC